MEGQSGLYRGVTVCTVPMEEKTSMTTSQPRKSLKSRQLKLALNAILLKRSEFCKLAAR